MNKEDLFKTFEDSFGDKFKAVCTHYNRIETGGYPQVVVSFVISVADEKTDLHVVDFTYLYCDSSFDEPIIELQNYELDHGNIMKILEINGRSGAPLASEMSDNFVKDLLFRKVDYMTEYYKEKFEEVENMRRFNDQPLTAEVEQEANA